MNVKQTTVNAAIKADFFAADFMNLVLPFVWTFVVGRTRGT